MPKLVISDAVRKRMKKKRPSVQASSPVTLTNQEVQEIRNANPGILQKNLPGVRPNEQSYVVGGKDNATITTGKQAMSNYLMQQDPYYLSLCNPFDNHGAKIPDFEVAPSGCVTLTLRKKLTATSTGCVGVALGLIGASGGTAHGSLVPLRSVTYLPASEPVSKTPGTAASYYHNFTNAIGFEVSTPTDIFDKIPNGTGSLKFAQWHDATVEGATTTWIGTSPMTQMFTRARVVSFGASLQFLGNFTKADGRIVAASVGRQTTDRHFLPTTTVDDVALLPGAKIFPVNQMGGASAIYRPTDNRSLQYTDIDAAAKFVNAGDATIESSWWDDRIEAMGGEIYLIADGVPEDAVFELTIVGNYEVAAKTAALNTVVVNSKTPDPLALAHIMGAVQKMPTVGPARPLSPLGQSSTTMMVQPSAQQPINWFDSLIKGVKSAIPVVKDVMSLVGV